MSEDQLRDALAAALDDWHRSYYVDEENPRSAYRAMVNALMPAVTAAIREAQAKAWDEGWQAGWNYGTETEHTNPYAAQTPPAGDRDWSREPTSGELGLCNPPQLGPDDYPENNP